MSPPSSRPVALVTGAARRVGAATVRALHAAGYDIALHYRHAAAEAAALAAELERARADSVQLLQAELAELGTLPGLVTAVLARHGRLDVLVNNASGFRPTPVGEVTPALWRELFASNAEAPFFLAQAALPALRATRGCIVNMVDIYAEHPLAGHAVYSIAKAALAQMTRALALELAPAVRVNGIAPGAILWPENGESDSDRAGILARIPLHRTGTPEDIAGAILWLVRDAPYVTGQILRIDGGRTLAV